MGNLCGVRHPLANDDYVEALCVLGKGHRDIRHEDEHGHRWSDPGQMSGDRSWRIRDEALRELLSYCDVESGGGPYEGPREGSDRAYSDVATKLRSILDGEK